MRIKTLFFFLYIFLSINTYAQKATVVFYGEYDCDVTINEPIDGGYNNHFPTKTMKISANNPNTYSVDTDTYAFIHCQISQGQNCKLIVFPNDSIKIHIKNKQITFEGSHHEGLQYLHDTFTTRSHYDIYMGPMENIITEYIEEKREFNTVTPEINKTIIQPTMREIDKIMSTSNTSQEFIKVFKKNILIKYNSYLILLLRSILEVDDYKVTALKDSIKIIAHTDNLFKTTSAFNKEILKYEDYNLFVSQYLIFYYGEKCPEGYDDNTFGPFGCNLYAPVDMQPILLGESFLSQMERSSPKMNLRKVKEFLNNNFPNSQYTAIINDRTKKANHADEIMDKISYSYIKQTVDSLSQLKDVPQLASKYLLIDLWASWCMPCRHEFKYKNELHKLLSTYNNIELIYISIDKLVQQKDWIQCINDFKLGGFHLLASTSLQNNIQKQIFKNEEFTIPHYILLDQNGEILHKNLPRPSNINKLKETLDSLINQ